MAIDRRNRGLFFKLVLPRWEFGDAEEIFSCKSNPKMRLIVSSYRNADYSVSL